MCGEKTLKEVYERQFNRVYRVAYILLNDTDKVEDAVQGVFFKFFNCNIRFIDDEHEKTWFITVTRNACQDVMDKERKTSIGFKCRQEFLQESGNRNREFLLDIIMELPSKYREVLYLFCYEGYQVKEMSKYFQLSESEIYSRLKTARKLLKVLFEGDR